MTGGCAICGREETLTRHHLIPRTRHHNKRNKREFNTVEKLRAHPGVARFAVWIATKPRGFRVPTSRSNARVG